MGNPHAQAKAHHEEVRLRVGLLPDAITEKALTRMSRNLDSEFGIPFVVGGEGFFAHLSLFHSKFKSLEGVEITLARLAKQTKQVEIIIEGIRIAPGNFVFLECSSTPALKRLHLAVLDSLEDAIATRKEPSVSNYKNKLSIKLTKKQIMYADRYRYPFVKEYFEPHFTIARLRENPDSEKVKSILKRQSEQIGGHSFIAKEIAIFQQDKYGSCAAILSKLPLSKR